MYDEKDPAEVVRDIKLFGSLLGLSEAECEHMAGGGSARARKLCRDEMRDRYYRENWHAEERHLAGLEQLDFWQQTGKADSFVYFVQSGESGPVKLGLAKDPLRRMAELQVGNPEELSLRHVVPGKRAEEAKLHHRFREARIRGEWFGLSYLEIILIFGAGMATSHIKCFEESGFLGVTPLVPEIPDIRSEKDQLRIRHKIEKLWLDGHNAAEIAGFLIEMDEDEVRAEMKEMRRSDYWRVGRSDGIRGYGGFKPARSAT